MWEEATHEGMLKRFKTELHTSTENENEEVNKVTDFSNINTEACNEPSGIIKLPQIDPSLSNSTPANNCQPRSAVAPKRETVFKARPKRTKKIILASAQLQFNNPTAPQISIQQSSSMQMELPARPNLLKELPGFIQPYMNTIYDVKADGHCGFRAVAACIVRGEEAYMAI